jgi:hypothetical protein
MPWPVSPAILDPQHTGPTILAAPWTADQVDNLNRYQRLAAYHPFTCGRRDEHPDDPGVLVATPEGWDCPADGCDYRQGWAHPFMAAPPTPAMEARERERAALRARGARPRPCLLHEDIHPHEPICLLAYGKWLSDRQHLVGRLARDAYALEVEQRILDRLVREHAPATTRRANPALSK